MSDPFKDMVRRYDRAVVAKGDRSIFTLKAEGAFQRAVYDREWRAATPHVHDTTPGPRPDGRAIFDDRGTL